MNRKAILLTGSTISLALLFTSLFLLLISAQAATAAGSVHYVAPSGDCGSASPCYETVQEAVDAAVAGDEVRVAAGMFPIQGGAEQVALVEKSLSIKGGYTTSNWNTPDPDANATILNALGQGRVMFISGTVEVSVEGLQLIYGSSVDLGNGGGIYANGADLTLRHSWVMTNTADSDAYGGGINFRNGTLLIDSCTIQSNTAGSGAGIRIYDSQASIKDSYILENIASAGSSSGHGGAGVLISGSSQVTMTGNVVRGNETGGFVYGGGVSLYERGSYNGGTLSLYLYDNLIEGNFAGIGAGVLVDKSFSDKLVSAQIISNTIRDNYTSNNGAGIAAGSSISEGGTNITVTHNLITNNHAGLDPSTIFVDYGTGGGMSIFDKALIEHNRIVNNEAQGTSSLGFGGGVELNGGGSIIFRYNQVTGNYASAGYMGGRGGGIYVSGDNVLIEANLIQGNSVGGGEFLTGGGGVNINNGDIQFINNIVTDNSVSGDVSRGSGITIEGGAPTLKHNTIANNSGGGGQGVLVIEGDNPGQPVFYNTIVASQTVGIQVGSGSPQNLATLYGVLWFGNAEDYNGMVYAFDETTGDPAFVDPAVGDYHIGPLSAAIDMGDDSAGVFSDIDFEPRFDIPDLGADEYWAPGTLQRRFIPIVAK